MNNKEFCFIMCTNDSTYENECIKYINSLIIPEGYTIDVLSVQEAKSMTSGYNEAMNFSEAKYKIYLHQDVFIVNKNFLSDLLELFSDSSVGMIGMIGTINLPDSCIPWQGERIGKIYTNHILYSELFEAESDDHIDRNVLCIDGLLMATQYDLPWREDLFKNWDFYDVSQSYEFRKKGYDVIVPKMDTPWVIHDDGILNLSNYEHEKEIFKKNYLT